MKQVAGAFEKDHQTLKKGIYERFRGTGPIDADVRRVATAFGDLQKRRHDADYDLGRSFRQSETLKLVEQAGDAIQRLPKIVNIPDGRMMLLMMLTGITSRAS